MTWYKITNNDRKVQLEISDELIINCIEIAIHRKPAVAKELIKLYENLEGIKYTPKKNNVPMVRK